MHCIVVCRRVRHVSIRSPSFGLGKKFDTFFHFHQQAIAPALFDFCHFAGPRTLSKFFGKFSYDIKKSLVANCSAAVTLRF